MYHVNSNRSKRENQKSMVPNGTNYSYDCISQYLWYQKIQKWVAGVWFSFAGVCWRVLVCAGVCWCVLVCAGVCWCTLVGAVKMNIMEKMRRIHEGGKAIFPGQIRERA